jgi:hypothetical protein
LASTFSQATGINGRGRIIGFMAVGGNFDAHLIDHGVLADLSVDGGFSTIGGIYAPVRPPWAP